MRPTQGGTLPPPAAPRTPTPAPTPPRPAGRRCHRQPAGAALRCAGATAMPGLCLMDDQSAHPACAGLYISYPPPAHSQTPAQAAWIATPPWGKPCWALCHHGAPTALTSGQLLVQADGGCPLPAYMQLSWSGVPGRDRSGLCLLPPCSAAAAAGAAAAALPLLHVLLLLAPRCIWPWTTPAAVSAEAAGESSISNAIHLSHHVRLVSLTL